MSQVATPELQQWIVEQARAGCKPEAVLSAMTQAGWREDVAIAAMEATLGEHLAALPRTTAPEAPAEPKRLPEPQMTGHPRQVDAGDRLVDIVINMQSPRVVVFGNLLSDEECDALIADAEPRLKRSLTVETQTGGEALNAYLHGLAATPNPVGLLGAIYIIEGTGQRIVPSLLPLLRASLPLPPDAFRFLEYHGANDEHHLERWLMAVQMVMALDGTDDTDGSGGTAAQAIVRTARHTAALYLMQFEHVLTEEN